MGGPLESLPRYALIGEPLMADPFPFVKNVRNGIEERSKIHVPISRALEAYFQLETIAPKHFLKALTVNRINTLANEMGRENNTNLDPGFLEMPETLHLSQSEPMQIKL